MKIPTILKGDDARAITLSLDSSHTYLNAVLVVAYQGVTKTFAGLSAGGTVSLVYTHDETKLFCLGCYPVEARLIGAGGSVETISNAEWRIKVTDILAEVNCGASFEVVPGSASVPVTDIEEIGDRYKLPDLAAKVNEICRILAQKTTLAIAIMLAAVGAFAASVQTARLDEMYNDAQVVTDVTFDPAPDFSTSNETLVATIRDEVAPISNDVAALSDTAATLSDSIEAISATVETNAAAIATLADTTATLSDSIVTGISNLSTRVDGKVEQTDFDAATNSIAGTIAPLAGIPALIPAQASPTNQLADKQFVNSSIATSTANFCGTSAATNEDAFVEWLEAIEVANDNDYVFWQTEDGDGNAVFKRYKYVEDPSGLGEEALAGHWLFEYDLNNSSFTAVQWAAINSGVTSETQAKVNNALDRADEAYARAEEVEASLSPLWEIASVVSSSNGLMRICADFSIETTAANRAAWENANAHVWLSSFDGDDVNDGLSPTGAVKTIIGAYNAAYNAVMNGTLNASKEVVVAVAEGVYAPVAIYAAYSPTITNGIVFVATGDRNETILDGASAPPRNSYEDDTPMYCETGTPFTMTGWTITRFNRSMRSSYTVGNGYRYAITDGIKFKRCDITGNHGKIYNGWLAGEFEECDIHGNSVRGWRGYAVYSVFGCHDRQFITMRRCHVWDNDFSECAYLFWGAYNTVDHCLFEVDFYESYGGKVAFMSGGYNTIIAKTFSNPNIEDVTHKKIPGFHTNSFVVVAAPGPGYDESIYGIGDSCVVSNANLTADFVAADASCPSVRGGDLPDYGYRNSGFRHDKAGADALRDMESRFYVVTTNVLVSSGADGYWICDWDGVTLDKNGLLTWSATVGGVYRVLRCEPLDGNNGCCWLYNPDAKMTGGVSYQANGSIDDMALDFAISDDNHLTFTRVRASTNVVITTNYVVRVAPVEMPTAAAERGVTFRDDRDRPGEEQNVAIAIGAGAVASVVESALLGAKSNKVVRSSSVAIGGNAVATNATDALKHQAIAIGWNSTATGINGIAIGSGAMHADETPLTDDTCAAALGQDAIGIGYGAKGVAKWSVAVGSSPRAEALNTIAMGHKAKADAEGAVQIGTGTNSTPGTVQFGHYRVLDADGQVPYERVAGAVAQAGVEFEVALSNAVRRILAGGNMAVVGDGSEGEQILEPKIGGLSEVEFVPNTNGVHEASTLVYLDPPPQAARNYDILISEIPEPMWMGTNGWETVALENRLRVGFTDLPPQYGVTMHVDDSCGFPSSPRVASVTNAPTIVKIREVSTNKVLVVVKPYRLEDL